MPSDRLPASAFIRCFGRAALAGAVLLIGRGPAAADAVRLHYELSLIGLPLGAAEARADIGPSRYTIALEAKLTGIAALVSSAKGAATASGFIVKGRVAPIAYATTSANARMTRTVRMAMTEGSVKAVDIEPPMEDDPGRIPVTEDLKRNIVDPVSALVMTVPPDAPPTGPAACNRSIPVFDGYARFNITLTYVASRHLKIHGYNGPVSVCAARYVPIAGYRPDRPGTKFMENDRQLEVWLAPLPTARVELPVRISIETMVGMTVIQATDLDVDEGDSDSPAAR
jgi:Protein of unknown function (DUF3108)